MLMTEAAKFGRYQAPQDNGQVLVVPSEAELANLVERNRQRLAHVSYDVQGRRLPEMAAAARRALIEQAIRYTSQYRDISAELVGRKIDAAETPLLLTGHQPQLFHPGVWYKNFLLGRIADQINGVGIHLLIDSDICRSASIRVPTGTVEKPYVDPVAFDGTATAVPFEERLVTDEDTFSSFPKRVVQSIRPLVDKPLVKSLWNDYSRKRDQTANLGLRLAQRRHALEAEWGNETLELPQSAVCQLPEFHWFVAHLLAHLPRFWTAHNDALAAYRLVHRLRNRAHPVPDLVELDGWLEAPFWIWTADDPRRRPLFARQQGNEIVTTDRHDQTFALKLSAEQSATDAASRLAELAERGVKIRTRALATTLFARMLLGDLFIHGIGGAKYDQVTDQIAEQFLGYSLPEFAAASATLRLPIKHPKVDTDKLRTLRQQMRETWFHPERFLLADGEAATNEMTNTASIVAEKRRWIDTPKSPTNARVRHRAIVEANESLQPHVAAYQQQLQSEFARIEPRARAAAILASREYSFCLFPREELQRLLLDESATTP